MSAAQHTPGPMDWDEIVRRQQLLADRSIGDDRVYEFACLEAMQVERNRAAIAKTTGSAA